MNHAAFFARLRRSRLFGGVLTQGEVDGINAILAEARARQLKRPYVAYLLATAFGETDGTMQPRRENLFYTTAARLRQVWPSIFRHTDPQPYLRNPQRLANLVYDGKLGNRPGTDDGWRFRGAGMGQITGRDNFAKFGRALGLDLEGRPDQLEDVRISARALVVGMVDGLATGKRLSNYLDGSPPDYIAARRVWNGTFEATKYAGFAQEFEAALDVAGYYPDSIPRPAEALPGVRERLSWADRFRRYLRSWSGLG